MKKEVIVSLIYAVLGFLMPLLNVVLNHESGWAGVAFAAVTALFVVYFVEIREMGKDWKAWLHLLWCILGACFGALIL